MVNRRHPVPSPGGIDFLMQGKEIHKYTSEYIASSDAKGCEGNKAELGGREVQAVRTFKCLCRVNKSIYFSLGGILGDHFSPPHLTSRQLGLYIPPSQSHVI